MAIVKARGSLGEPGFVYESPTGERGPVHTYKLGDHASRAAALRAAMRDANAEASKTPEKPEGDPRMARDG